MDYDFRELFGIIKAANVCAFRLCPISCYQYPVIYFLSPYPKKMLPFIEHTIAHEILHLKYALFREDRCPYFAKREDVKFWHKAGYHAFSLEEFFEDFVNEYGVKNSFALISEYGDRFRDFFINLELLKNSFTHEITKKWETHELFSTTKEKMIKYLCRSNTLPNYKLKLLTLDTGIKLALLSGNVSPKRLEERPVFHNSYPKGEKIVKKTREMLQNMRYICNPHVLAKKIVELDKIVELTKLL